MRRGLAFVALSLIAVGAAAQRLPIEEMEFTDQPVVDILLALAKASGRSIVPDQTVTGNASYYFKDTDLDAALALFLPRHRLYTWIERGIYYVSRIRVHRDEGTGLVSVDAEEVDAPSIVRALSRAIRKTVLYDALPSDLITVHADGLTPDAILESIALRFPGITLEAGAEAYYLKREPPASEKSLQAEANRAVERAGDRYSLTARQIRFRDAVQALFARADREYSLLGRSNPLLERLSFRDKSFEELLALILELGESACSQVGKVCYIYDARKGEILGRFASTVVVPLTYLQASQLPGLLPPGIAGSESYKVDAQSNAVILNGTLSEIGPMQRFIESVDRPLTGKQYYRFDLSYLDAKEVVKTLPATLAGAQAVALPGSNSFLLLLSPEMKASAEAYVQLVDRREQGVPMRLEYIRSSELLKNLPPSASKEEIVATSDPSLIFFCGSERKQHQFRRELALIDRPTPQIKYEILVIQYQQGEKLDHDVSVSSSLLKRGDRNAFIGTIGRLLSLNFDIVSAFGYLFALNLNLCLTTSRAKVLADTTLNGLSGQEIRFQNTDTFRYRDTFVDPETGTVNPTGVVRELTSGLIIEIDGWVSGSETITMNIRTTISKRGADTSGGEAALPPTTEKIIDTHVRTRAGAPVIIGGLIERDEDEQTDKLPGVGDLPLVGPAFQHSEKSAQDTDLEVYILPHIEYPAGEGGAPECSMRELYERYIAGGKQ